MQYYERKPLTADEVLAIFREEHRLGSPLDCMADENFPLGFNTTIEEWINELDLVPVHELWKGLNKQFGIHATEREWRRALATPHQSTLWNVCWLVAEHLSRPGYTYAPVRWQCRAGAAFLSLKRALRRRGVDVSALSPSALLLGYLQGDNLHPVFTEIQLHARGKQIINHFDLRLRPVKRKILWGLYTVPREEFDLLPHGCATFRELAERIAALSASN